jgi:Zn-finger nucleic acid-binding protein
LTVFVCADCKGVLVRQPDVTGLLEAVAPETTKGVDLDAPIEPLADRGGMASCPLCARDMENYGYMGSKSVMIDCCSRCGVLWLDTDELGVMSLMFASAQRRTRVLHERAQQRDRVSARMVELKLLHLAAERAVFNNYLSQL